MLAASSDERVTPEKPASPDKDTKTKKLPAMQQKTAAAAVSDDPETGPQPAAKKAPFLSATGSPAEEETKVDPAQQPVAKKLKPAAVAAHSPAKSSLKKESPEGSSQTAALGPVETTTSRGKLDERQQTGES